MKKTISILLVAAMLSTSAYCEVTKIAEVVPVSVMADMNKPLEPQPKITTGGWVWIGVFTIFAGVFGSLTYSTKKPI